MSDPRCRISRRSSTVGMVIRKWPNKDYPEFLWYFPKPCRVYSFDFRARQGRLWQGWEAVAVADPAFSSSLALAGSEATPRPKRQRTGALPDAPRSPGVSWSAGALRRSNVRAAALAPSAGDIMRPRRQLTGAGWSRPTKRQRTGALQDAPRSPSVSFRAPASGSAAALHRSSHRCHESLDRLCVLAGGIGPILTRTSIRTRLGFKAAHREVQRAANASGIHPRNTGWRKPGIHPAIRGRRLSTLRHKQFSNAAQPRFACDICHIVRAGETATLFRLYQRCPR